MKTAILGLGNPILTDDGVGIKIAQKLKEEKSALKLNEDYCGNRFTCFSLGPFEAIKRDSETSKTFLKIEKCQVRQGIT